MPVRERYGLLEWAGAAAVSMFMMARLEPSVVGMWNKIKLVQTFIGTQPGRSVRWRASAVHPTRVSPWLGRAMPGDAMKPEEQS